MIRFRQHYSDYYVNDLVEALNNTNIGISIGDLKLSCLLYADDLVLLGNSLGNSLRHSP